MEQWRTISGYEGLYEVSDLGQVRRVAGSPRCPHGRILKLNSSGPTGRLTVALSSAGNPRTHLVHQLVAQAFLGPQPDGTEVCHGNGRAGDNRAENLRWGTHAENMQDALEHGTHYSHGATMTRCKRGHEFTPENTYTNNGKRVCRECRRAHKRAWRARRKAA